MKYFFAQRPDGKMIEIGIPIEPFIGLEIVDSDGITYTVTRMVHNVINTQFYLVLERK